MRCIKFSLLFCSIYRKLFKKIFIYTTDKILFLPKCFMTNFIYFINNLLYIIRS